MKTQIILLFISFVLNGSYSKVEHECRNIPLRKDVDFQKLGGRWHLSLVGNPELAGQKCITYDATVENTPNGTVATCWINGKDKRQEAFKIFSVNNTSHVVVQINGNREKSEEKRARLLSTDYNSFVVWYLCIPGTEDGGHIYAATRKRPQSKLVGNVIRTVCNQFGFNLSNLHSVNQNDCNN